MKPAQMLLVAGAVSALMLSATPVQAADPRTLIITDVGGAVRIQQDLPCGNALDLTTDIAKGGIEMTWTQTRQGVQFDLPRMAMFVNPFHAEAACNGVGGSVDFREIGIQLASGVRFTGEQTGGRESGQFRFTIPKEQFLIFESVVDNAPVRQPETSYQKPSEDVTGVIDLRNQTVQLHVVLTTELRFRAGCEGDRCVIDETRTGTITSDVRGAAFSETRPPVTCTPVTRSGNRFQVSASGDVVITLGTFTLANDEVIQLLPTRQPGVRLLTSTRSDGLRQFQVGPGEAFITATDPANISTVAYCR